MTAARVAATARAAVAAYRAEPMRRRCAQDEEVLNRLEADPEWDPAVGDGVKVLKPSDPRAPGVGNVSWALKKLRAGNGAWLLFVVLQAADLALSAEDIEQISQARADEYRQAAKAARELWAFCKGRTPMHLWVPLAALAPELDEYAQRAEDQPRRLQIKRTKKGKNGPAILALRHIAARLRECGVAHPNHQALARLVEATLRLDRPLPPHVVADAVEADDVGMEVGPPRPRPELPLSGKPLKRRRISRL